MIIIVALLLVALILVVGNQSFKATEKAAFDEFNRRQLVLAQGATGGIEMYFGHLAGDMMKALARMPEVQRLDETATRREMQRRFDELEPWGVNDVGVLDANGILKYNVAARQLEGVDFSWRRYYREVKRMTSSDTYVIEFIEFKGVEAGQKGVLVAVPMFETATDENHPAPSGRFAGVLLCTLKLDTVTQRFVAPIKSSERGHAFLIDGDYNVLWAPDGSLFGKNLLEAGQGFPAFQQIVEKMSAGTSGTGEYAYYKFEDATGQYAGDKEEKLIAYAPIRLGDELWAIGVWAPKEDVQKLIRTAYHKQLSLLGSIILIILIGSSYALTMSSRISKFLEQEVETKTRELRGSIERFIAVLDSLDAAVYVADMETYEILFVNKYLGDLLGDVVGKTCWQALQSGRPGPCDFCTNEKLLSAGGEPAGVYAWEFQNTVTGRWYEIRDRAIRWVDGRIVRLEIAIDITERVRAEDALRESEEKFRSLIQVAASVILYLSPDGRILEFNPEAERLYGRKRGEVLGESYLELFLPEAVRDAVAADIKKVLAGEPSRGFENSVLAVDGSECTLQWYVNRLLDAQGQPAGIVAVGQDVTERMQAEKTLRESEERYRSLVESARDVICTLSPDGTITSLNPAFETITGWTRAEWIGKPFAPILHPDDLSSAMEMFQRVLHRETPPTYELRVLSKSDEYKVGEFTTTPQIQDGRMVGVLSIARDITARVQAEEELRQHRDHLEELVEERTAELRRVVNLMAGREVRMAELKDVIRQLRAQLQDAGLTPMADDPLAPWQETEE